MNVPSLVRKKPCRSFICWPGSRNWPTMSPRELIPAATVNSGGGWRGSRSGEIYLGELAKSVSQKAVDCTARGARGVREAPYNFAGGINIESIGVVRTGEIDSDKGYICCLTPRGITSILGKHHGRHAKQTAHQ